MSYFRDMCDNEWLLSLFNYNILIILMYNCDWIKLFVVDNIIMK